MLKHSPTALAMAIVTAGVASAQNDECATAATLALGTTAFDTSTATLSAEPWPCANAAAPDLWYVYTAANSNAITFDLCGSSYDTALEILQGPCGAQTSLFCNDDDCGLQSGITVPGGMAGDVYYVRVGGFTTNSGAGQINVAEIPPSGIPNDDCAGAIAVGLGTTAFDTTGALTSTPGWPCAAGGADIWYTYTAANTNDINIALCGSSYDTALEVFDGTCGALNAIDCNDDSCGLQSSITIGNVVAGTTYTFRIGGFASNTGLGTMDITEQTPPPPPTPNCVETLFASNNGGNVGGGIYFDITVTQNISIASLLANTSVNGAAVGMTVYTIAGTYAGNETNMAAWTMVAEDDGLSIGLGNNAMTPLNFVTPFSLAPGTYGIALIGDNFTTGSQMDHDYTNGTGANQNHVSPDGVITLDLGTASNAGFTAPLFNPRVWNGRICSSGPIAPGTNYCGPAVANSTGNSAEISASGSGNVAANDLVLEASNLPPNSFGFFLTSQAQGLVMNPGGSQGNLCLGGAIGRYVGPGQIQQAGAGGTISLAVDNSMQPTPTGLVQVNAGETWHYTTWFRDMPSTSNFTDGYTVNHN